MASVAEMGKPAPQFCGLLDGQYCEGGYRSINFILTCLGGCCAETTTESADGGLSAAQQQNYVEQNKDRYHHFQSEHAALVELGDHEFVKLTCGF
jgi:hypothetical protein